MITNLFCWFGISAWFSADIRVNPTKLSFKDLLFSGDHPFSCSRPHIRGEGPASSKFEIAPSHQGPRNMIEPIIIRHFLDIADAQQDLAASLKRAIIIANKIEKQQSDLVATLTANLEEAIAAVLKGNGRGPTAHSDRIADADPINVSRVDGVEHAVPQ